MVPKRILAAVAVVVALTRVEPLLAQAGDDASAAPVEPSQAPASNDDRGEQSGTQRPGGLSGAPSERSSIPAGRVSGPGQASATPALAPPDEDWPDEDNVRRGELGGLPAIAGNNTFGVILGATGSFTFFEPGYEPFRFRLQLLAITAIKPSEDGPRLPVQDVDLRVDFPGLAGGRLRLYGVARYLRIEDVGYWGIGNAASGRLPESYLGPEHRFFNYLKQMAEARVFARWRVRKHWDLVGGLGIRAVFPGVFEDSRLERDLEGNGPAADLLHGYTRQFITDGLLGVLYDSRDDEFNPTLGAYHEVSVRAGGGPSRDAALRYGALYVHGRWFVPLLGPQLVLALRGLVDVGFGRVPLVELGTIGGYTSIPGPASIEANRGLPFGRQLGKVKVLSTVELRSTFYHFTAFGQKLALGVAGFVDASRVWAELGPNPLDDGGPALRFSFGMGPRLIWGKGLVIRVDAAASPKGGVAGKPSWAVGLDLGHVF